MAKKKADYYEMVHRFNEKKWCGEYIFRKHVRGACWKIIIRMTDDEFENKLGKGLALWGESAIWEWQELQERLDNYIKSVLGFLPEYFWADDD